MKTLIAVLLFSLTSQAYGPQRFSLKLEECRIVSASLKEKASLSSTPSDDSGKIVTCKLDRDKYKCSFYDDKLRLLSAFELSIWSDKNDPILVLKDPMKELLIHGESSRATFSVKQLESGVFSYQLCSASVGDL